MKNRFTLFVLAMLLALPSILFSQNYPLQVILTPSSDFTSYFGELKENPGRYMQVRVINNSGASRNVYFQMRIERLYPSTDISVYSNLEKKPDLPIPIAIGSNSMRMDQLDDNFATHQYEDFAVSGIEVNSVDDLMGSFRIPEGQYKLCLIAYDYDTPIGSEPVMLSDPNFSCAQVRICYSASKIELLSPVNTMIAGNSSNVVIQPKRNLLVQWTQPTTTCGASMGNVDYELKFTDIYDGQTEEDALNYNPILLSLSYKNKTSVMLDTMQYQGIFNNGKRYAIGVTATASNQDIAILNDGKTTPASFIYGELPPNKGQQNTVKSKPSITNVPDCGNAVPDNKELIATLNINDIIHVGNYDMKLTKVSKNDDGSFKGKGTIDLASNHLFNGFPQIKAKVEFDKLQVNTGNQVIDGIVRTAYDTEKQKFFGGFGNDLSWDNNNLSKKDGEVLNENAKKIAQDFITSAMPKAEAEVNFPIKVESNGIEVAVSGMSFGAKGATFDMLYFMKIHEGDKLLAFGAKNICTNNNNVNDAKFYLLKDIKTKIEGLDFAIIGGEGKTYVKWDRQGYQGIKLSAKISVPNEVIIRKNGDAINDITINTEFMSWSNWEAKISIPDFKLAFCHDLSFDSLEARYVYNIDTTGIVFSNLNMKLPNYIKGLDGIIVESASILSRGFNLNLVKKNILSIDKGSIGGWGFSIDNLEFNIANNSFINNNDIGGRIRVPLFESEIAYSGSPTALNKMLNLNLTADLGKSISPEFLHYFDATIADNSRITIGSDGKIETNFNGKINVARDCDLGFNVEFQGLRIANYQGNEIGKFDFSVQSWKIDREINYNWLAFTFKIDDIKISNKTTEANINLDFAFYIDVALGTEELNFSGDGTPKFSFVIDKSDKTLSSFNFTFEEVAVRGEFATLSIDGSLKRFSNHPIYGNGISGELSCGFPLGINVNSEVRFGSANGNVKYFYAGGALRLSDEFAIPVGGVLGINGFGGAIWWNMKKTRDISSLSSMAAGSSSSDCGFNLVPVDKSTKTIGFAADVYFISLTGGSYLFNGKAGLNATFEGSNIGNLGVGGKIRVIGDGSDNDDRYVCHGELQMDFFFNNGKLNQFTLNAFANVDIMSGELQASLGINCDIQNEKYSFFLGKPIYSELRKCENKSDRAWCVSTGRDFNFIDASLMLQGYFCAGNISDNMPPLPKELVGLLSDGEINRPNSLNTGNRPGIMFGTRFSLDFNFDFGPIYASFYSVAGFDMEMKQSMGKGCKDGREIIGINGYYCRGQLYAYLSGKVGVSVKFFGKKIKADLCKVEAGALLRGGFPNPSWFKGSVAVRGEILGGLITFNTSARFTVGSECRDSEQVLDVVIIDEISPGFEKMQDAERQKKEEKPSIYNVNTITTHLPMNSPVVLYDLTGNTEDNLEYKFVFDEVTLRKVIDINSNRNPVVFLDTRELRGENRKSGKVFEIIPQEELEPFTMYQLTVTAKVLQNIDGKYQIPRGVKVSDTKQTKVVYFKTDDLPNFIHKDNIVACYPSHHQYELFRGLKDKWYITTAMSIGYLFNDRDKSLGEKAFLGALYDVQDDPERKKPKRFLYKYHPDGIKGIEGKNVITFSSMGSKNLEAEKIYEFRLFVVKTKQEATKYNKIQKEDIIAHEITEGGGDKASLGGSKRDEYRGVDIDKNLGGTKTGVGKHTGKVYEAIRGEQDARTNPLDGILRGGMNKGREIINQGSIANKGSQNTNKGNTVGGLSQGSVSGGMGLGNQAMNQGHVTTYSNTGGTTTKSKAMPAIPSGSNMSSNIASNGKVKAPAGTVSTISQIGKNNVGHINQIHYDIKNIFLKEHIDDTKTTYQDYKDVTSNTKLKYIGASNNVNDEVMSSAFVNKVNEYLDDSELEDIYQNAEIHQIYSNYFRVSGFLDPEQKFKTTLTNDVINLDDVPRSGFNWATKTKSYLDGQESKGMKEKLTSYPGDDFIAHYLPYHTTVEEMFGGKTINGSRAADLPSRIRSVPELFSAKYSAMNYLWQNYFFDFFRIIRSASTHFKLPYFDNNILPSDLSGMDNCVYYYNDPRYTSRREKFHGPLTDDEIATGSVRRSSNITRLTYQCHHAEFLALCMGYCLNLGYQIWDQDWFKRKDKSGKINSISVTDYLNSYYPDEDRGGYIVLDKEKYYDNRVLTQLMHDFDISYFGVPSQYNQEGTSYDRWYDNNYKRVKRASNKSCFLLPLNFYSLALHFDGCDECKEVKGHIPGSRAIKCLYEIGRAVYPEYHRVNNYFIEPVFNNRIEVNSCIRRNSSSVVEIDQLLY